MRRCSALALATAWLLASPLHAEPRVVTTSRALADLAQSVGGPEVEVQALMRGHENPHGVQPTPSLVLKLQSLLRSARRSLQPRWCHAGCRSALSRP